MTEAATDEAGFAAIVLRLATPSALLPEYTADTAKAKIAELKADKEFAERYLAGEVKATEEFKRLHGIASGKQARPNPAFIAACNSIRCLAQVGADLPENALPRPRTMARQPNSSALVTRMLVLGLLRVLAKRLAGRASRLAPRWGGWWGGKAETSKTYR